MCLWFAVCPRPTTEAPQQPPIHTTGRATVTRGGIVHTESSFIVPELSLKAYGRQRYGAGCGRHEDTHR